MSETYSDNEVSDDFDTLVPVLSDEQKRRGKALARSARAILLVEQSVTEAEDHPDDLELMKTLEDLFAYFRKMHSDLADKRAGEHSLPDLGDGKSPIS